MDPNIFKDADAATICSSGNDETPLSGGSGGGNDVGVGVSPKPRFLSMLPMPTASPAAGAGQRRRLLATDVAGVSAETTAPDRVTFRFSYLRAGTHTMRFRRWRRRAGAFALPPVKAFVQQSPEVMGLSPAGLADCMRRGRVMCSRRNLVRRRQQQHRPRRVRRTATATARATCRPVTCICDTGFAGAACADMATE